MKNWTGLLLLAAAAWLVAVALAQRRRVRAARREALARGESTADATLHPSLAMLGGILPPLVMLGLAIVAAQIVVAYVVMDGGRIFSLFDLCGFLALLAAYALWLIIKTQYREPAIAVAPRAAQGEAMPPPQAR
jgi:uncharacterized membrane protein